MPTINYKKNSDIKYMPTKCELIVEAKKKGIKGYSKLTKSELEKLIGMPAEERPSKKRKPKSTKRVLTEKQKAALAKARESRRKKRQEGATSGAASKAGTSKPKSGVSLADFSKARRGGNQSKALDDYFKNFS